MILRCAVFLVPFFAVSNGKSSSHTISTHHHLRSSGSFSSSGSINQPADANHHRRLVVADAVETIREEIRDLIRDNSTLAPKFLRLAFHDCVGGCDGCVDLTNIDNAGLDIPMDALASIVSTWKSSDVSRADIWSLAAMVGSEMTQSRRDFQ